MNAERFSRERNETAERENFEASGIRRNKEINIQKITYPIKRTRTHHWPTRPCLKMLFIRPKAEKRDSRFDQKDRILFAVMERVAHRKRFAYKFTGKFARRGSLGDGGYWLVGQSVSQFGQKSLGESHGMGVLRWESWCGSLGVVVLGW